MARRFDWHNVFTVPPPPNCDAKTHHENRPGGRPMDGLPHPIANSLATGTWRACPRREVPSRRHLKSHHDKDQRHARPAGPMAHRYPAIQRSSEPRQRKKQRKQRVWCKIQRTFGPKCRQTPTTSPPSGGVCGPSCGVPRASVGLRSRLDYPPTAVKEDSDGDVKVRAIP